MTDFEKKVLRQACKIPLGEVRSYKWLAEKIGCPHAWRAVANALAKNPFPVFIPCHRVVGSDGLGGYSLGRGLKRNLLRLEASIVKMLKK